MQPLLVLTLLLLWCSFIFGEQRILSPVHDELHTQASSLSQTEIETDDSNLVDVTADRRHHPVHPKPHHPHPNTKKHHPHHPAPKGQRPHGSKRHHPHETESLSDATDVTPLSSSSSSSSNVVPVPFVALEPALTSATEVSPSQTQSQSETVDSNLVEADRRHHPVHPKPKPKWHHPHSSKKPSHPHHPAGSHPHGPHRPHRPHDSDPLASSPSSLLSDSSSSSVSPPAGVPADLTLAAEQSADELSDLLAERAELAKISDQLSAIELQVVDAQAQQYKLSSQIAAAQKALKSQEAATNLLLLEQGYHAVADRDMSRYAAEMESMKMKVTTAASALHALEEEQKLREKNLKALLLQEADISSDHKLQVDITKKANELYCSNVCKSVKLTNCLAATSACDAVPKVKAVDWINSV